MITNPISIKNPLTNNQNQIIGQNPDLIKFWEITPEVDISVFIKAMENITKKQPSHIELKYKPNQPEPFMFYQEGFKKFRASNTKFLKMKQKENICGVIYLNNKLAGFISWNTHINHAFTKCNPNFGKLNTQKSYMTISAIENKEQLKSLIQSFKF